MIVTGWKETNKGRILEWKMAEKKLSSKKKFSQEQLQQITELRSDNKNLSQKDFLKKIELENNIKCSITTFKKIMDDNY